MKDRADNNIRLLGGIGMTALERLQEIYTFLPPEVVKDIDKIKGELYKMSAWGKEEISMLDIIYDLEGEE